MKWSPWAAPRTKGLFDGDTVTDRQLAQNALASVGLQGFEDHAFAACRAVKNSV